MSSLKLPDKPLQPFNVLAFDPGGTTGWAHGCLPGPIVNDVKLSSIWVQAGELTGQHHQELYDFINLYGGLIQGNELTPLEVVSEPFHYRQNIVEEGEKFRGKVELISAEYIGVIRLACAQLGLTYYDKFTPGEAKAYVPDKKLAALGWLQTPATPMRHRNDALRQLVKYLIVKKGIQHPITSAWRI